MTNITRIVQHDMPLYILLQAMQISEQQIMGAHQVPYFQHDGPKLFILLSHGRPLLQVKQARLVAEGMVQVTEFSLEGMAKILPCTNTQPGPILVSY